MDVHISRGFNPLSGLECVEAACGALKEHLLKHQDFSSNLAWPLFRFRIHAELEYAPNIHADVSTQVADVGGEHLTLDAEGKLVKTGKIQTLTTDISHDAEYPDLTREKFVDQAATTVDATTQFTSPPVSSARPEILTRSQRLATKGR